MGRKGREHAFCVHSNVLLAVVIVVVLMGGEVKGMMLEGGAIFAPSTEMLFLRWVHWVAMLGHSLYAPANNLFSCKTTLVVDKRPGALADFRSIQDAIDAVAPFNSARVIIKVRKGVYKEKVQIPSTKPFITLEGEGSDVSIIKWGDTADKPGPDGNPMGTFNSATVAIDASYFIAKNITFRNSAPLASPGAKGKQAVALRISGDTAAFLGCKFIGSQDTLYDHHGRHYFKECYIEGSVDFVFGDGLSMYEGCHVHGIEKNGGGAVTAQKRGNQMEDSGFSFVHCRVTGAASLYLGRAWGTFSRVVFSYTHMDNVVIPQGWYNWGDPQREQTVFFGQYKCYGPGAGFAGRALWSHELTDSEAKPFLDINFIDGYEWIQGI